MQKLLAALAVATASMAVGFGAVYATLIADDNGERGREPATAVANTATPSGAPLPRGAGTNPLSTGQMTAFVFKDAPQPVADIAFLDGTGASRSLSEWRGRTVVLNLWATWCAPCKTEMPSLERLQDALAGTKAEVIALAVDRTGLEGARQFFRDAKLERLPLYADPTGKTGMTLKAVGMPTTIVLNADGLEVGRLVGPAEWDSPDAQRLIAAVTASGQAH